MCGQIYTGLVPTLDTVYTLCIHYVYIMEWINYRDGVIVTVCHIYRFSFQPDHNSVATGGLFTL